MQRKRINNHKVKPLQIGSGVDRRPILGADLIPHLYGTMFLVAKKNSGKTTTIAKIINECVGRDTHVIAFTGTLLHDPAWTAIRDIVERNRGTFTGYTSLFDESGGNRVAQWLEMQKPPEGEEDIKDVAKEAMSDDEEEEVVEVTLPPPPINLESNMHLLDDPEPPQKLKKKKKKKKSKFRMPKTFFIFDDLGDQLRNPQIAKLIKTHRHYHTKIVLSSQYVKDITPETSQNIDIWIIFRGLSAEYIKRIYIQGSPKIAYEEFQALYEDATKDPYSFMYFDAKDNKYRKNFDEEYEVNHE